MTSKHWALVGGAVACLTASMHSSTAIAAPWIEPSDNRARFALQKLADRGHLNRTTSTWPMMMGTVHNGLNSKAGSYTPAIGGSLAYLKFENGKSLKPTDWDLVKRAHLSVSENKANGMLTISQSPIAAKQWADQLVNDINEHMRTQDVEEAEARVEYLQLKLHETNVAGMQQVFYQLIESVTRTVMLANAQKEYVFKTVDPAVVPQDKSEPKRALIAIVATMLGGMLAVFIVFIRAFIRSHKDPSTSD